jgi:hypothetical protein
MIFPRELNKVVDRADDDVSGGIPPGLTALTNSTICIIVKEIKLSRPELAFIIVTRAFLGAGIALLFSDRLGEKRKGGWGYPRPSRAGHDNSGRVGDFLQARVTSLIRNIRPDYFYPGQS